MIKCEKEKIFNECYRRQRKTFSDMENVHAFNIGIICIHGEELLRYWHSIKNTKDLTMKKMFDISAKLMSEQDEFYGVKTIDWENSSWKYLSLIGNEQVISLQRTNVYVFSESVLFLVKIHENSQSNGAWEQRLEWLARWMGPQGRTTTGGGGPARVPNVRVCKHPCTSGVAHAGREGWINILPWYHLMCVAKTSGETQRRKSWAARKGEWPPRGTEIPTRPMFPGSAPKSW